MTIHTMKLSAAPYKMVASGQKTIESRLYDEKRQLISPGDVIEFTCSEDPTQKILTDVKALYRYASFREMFYDFSPAQFGGASIDQLTDQIQQFYSEEDQKKYGVLGIKISLQK